MTQTHLSQAIQAGTRRCLILPGHGIDHAISQLLSDTITPLALDVALTVQAELEARADHADQLRATHVQRARQHTDLARRRYLSVDPANRLVADTLEADYNQALRDQQTAQEAYQHAAAAAKTALDEEHKTRIRELATDFPKMWADPATGPRERKRIARLLIQDVTLTRTDQIHLHVRLRGGQTTSLTIPTPLNAWQARQTDPGTLAALHRLLDHHTDSETAAQLNTDGHTTGHGRPFTATIVVGLRRAHQLPSRRERLLTRGLLTQAQIADQLNIHPVTVRAWQRAGLLQSHKATDKNERLYEPPARDDPRLAKQRGRRLDQRELIQPRP